VAVDECGHDRTGAGTASADRLDEAARALLLFAGDAGDVWEETVADDPAFAPATSAGPTSAAPPPRHPTDTRPT
jgi:hypothetical protein